ncbi:hypothetical protein SERLADRAFT_480559 [Serpula lacrymans var. lacrymans S7.9]|uniref:O-methyltransferase C-terminal domain-containing protein n=1 Tax=Serpula lacrymans var. lacrymans (strain S7.9) TaxID=578457 RepID=F8PDQ9_SERL9|nr:uncharacterized protein SERLADRAFT_480559 [Serpula lacrymans var. lacrymans S7.9]EGO18879.1 hypothetical protein SERLADRAFT_480559 [Serpula lacrymans var. lacrymans S7.9]
MSAKVELQGLLALINSSANEAIAEYDKAGQEVPTLDSTLSHPLDTALDSLALKKAIRVLEGACQQLCATLAPPQHTVINFVQNYDSACVRVAIKSSITTILEAHPNGLHVKDLSDIVHIESGKLSRVLRSLATKGCYREVTQGIFANNRLSLVLRPSIEACVQTYLHTEIVMSGASVLYENLTNQDTAFSYEPSKAPIMEVLKKEGITGTFFDWMTSNPNTQEEYHRGMIGVGSIMGSLSVLEHFPWKEVSTVCDLGSGIGPFSLPLAKMYPNLHITCHDLPEVLAQAQVVWAQKAPEAVSGQNVEFVPLNFLQKVPVQGQDVYYLRHIIHDWPDAEATVILRNVRQAMAPHSRLLIQDYVMLSASREDDNVRHNATVAPKPLLPNYGAGNMRLYQSDLSMLIIHNARERTLDEVIKLGDDVGLQLAKVWDLGESCAIEFKLA